MIETKANGQDAAVTGLQARLDATMAAYEASRKRLAELEQSSKTLEVSVDGLKDEMGRKGEEVEESKKVADAANLTVESKDERIQKLHDKVEEMRKALTERDERVVEGTTRIEELKRIEEDLRLQVKTILSLHSLCLTF